jgi:hypothetical protein
MSFRIHCRVGARHVRQSGYETREEALDAAITMIADGAVGVYIIDGLDHVFTPTRFAKQMHRRKGARQKNPRPSSWVENQSGTADDAPPVAKPA